MSDFPLGEELPKAVAELEGNLAERAALVARIAAVEAERDTLRLQFQSAMTLLDISGPYGKEADDLWLD